MTTLYKLKTAEFGLGSAWLHGYILTCQQHPWYTVDLHGKALQKHKRHSASDLSVALLCQGCNSSTVCSCRCFLNPQHKASTGFLCHEDCLSGNVSAPAEDEAQWFCIWRRYLVSFNSIVPSTRDSATVQRLCHLVFLVLYSIKHPVLKSLTLPQWWQRYGIRLR